MTISIACAACRAPNERGARFCRRCGTPLTQDVAPPPVAIACPTCGQPVTGSQKFCRGCGHPLAAVAPGSQGAARSEPAPAPAAQATAEAPRHRAECRHRNHRYLQPTACRRVIRNYPWGHRGNRLPRTPDGGKSCRGRLASVCWSRSVLQGAWCTPES
ncbi:MAG: zinc ribbon domain-containing protein [Thermomonas sp.]|nr:zinc ribbon domain-containing protein [Thermomonas sp.]